MKAHARFFFLILICILTVFSVGIVSAEADGAKPFSTDYEAINEAAQSMFLVEVYDRNDTLIKTGSGFIAFDEHYFVTNHHVIEDAQYLIVVDDNGKEYKVTDLLVADEEKDIAILSFDEAANYRPLPLCATDDLLRGQPVIAIGSPQGVRNTVSIGTISNLMDDNGTLVIQFTAASSHGSSGGALFNDNGKVIGLIYGGIDNADNMNYATTIKEVVRLKSGNMNTVPLNSYKVKPDDILYVRNHVIKAYGTTITLSNSDIHRTITSIVLSYSFPPNNKTTSLLVKEEIDLPPEKTKNYKIDLNYIDKNASRILIGVKYIKFEDGSVIQCENKDIHYQEITFDVNEKERQLEEIKKSIKLGGT